MHHEAISSHYSQIIMAITVAANCTVPKIPCSSLRPFWTEELDELKSDSIFWYHMWRDAGYPSSGWLCHIKNSCKFKYKLAIKQAFRDMRMLTVVSWMHIFSTKIFPSSANYGTRNLINHYKILLK